MTFTSIDDVTIWIAFLAGLASFLSPCVFALVPAYVSYLSGRSLAAAGPDGETKANKWVSFSHGLAFVVGFTIVFVLLGIATGALAGAVFGIKEWLARIGGVIVVIFGLHMVGIIHIPFLEYDLRPQNNPDRSRGYLSSMMMGVFFSAGWAPCVGPVLGLILTLSLNGGSLSLGATLLTAYSIGLGIPFLLATFGIDWVTNILRNHGGVMRWANIIMGIVMIIIGALLATGKLETILAPLTGEVYIDFGL